LSEHRDLILRIERTFRAPIERVFDAWTDPEVMRRWLHAGADWETPTAEVELRVGGRIRVVMRNPEDGSSHGMGGEFVLIERPHRLVFTWTFDSHAQNAQLIELELAERDGATTVVMTNSAIAAQERWESQQRGWRLCYDNLERVLAARR
jgi:uncharacterized protein YndB with AHSA1/START domain